MIKRSYESFLSENWSQPKIKQLKPCGHRTQIECTQDVQSTFCVYGEKCIYLKLPQFFCHDQLLFETQEIYVVFKVNA